MADEKQYVDYETFKHYDELLKAYIYYMFHKHLINKDEQKGRE